MKKDKTNQGAREMETPLSSAQLSDHLQFQVKMADAFYNAVLSPAAVAKTKAALRKAGVELKP